MQKDMSTSSSRVLRIALVSQIRNLQEAVEEALARSLGVQDALRVRNYSQVKVEAISPSTEPSDGLDQEIALADPKALAPFVSGNQCPNLKWCQSTFAGVDPLVNALKDQEPYFVCTKLGDVFGTIMAEYVIGHIIAWVRKFSQCYNAQQSKEWIQQDVNSYKRLSSLTVGVLGAGNIGQEVLHKCSLLGMNVIGMHSSEASCDRALRNKKSYKPTASLDHVLEHCDVIVNLFPSTPETKYVLDAPRLAAAGNNIGLLINAGRGDIMKEEEIISCLDQGLIEHCVLDVFEKEPLPSKSPLWSHPSITITPHVAAVSLPQDTARVFVENLQRWLSSAADLKYQIDWKKGY